MKTEKQIKEMYFDNCKTLENYCKNPEFIYQNFKMFQDAIVENRILKNILEIKD